MKIAFKVALVLFLTLCLLQGFSPGYRLQAKNYLKPDFVSDTLPNTIQVYLDDVVLCNQRNNKRPADDQLECTGTNIDPDTYTMDEYVTGVLHGEVGPVADIAHWHIEALKAMAVKIRTFGWSRATDLGNGVFEIKTLYVQSFYPEKPVDDEQKYQDAATLTTGQYLSHPEGSGAAGVISAQHRQRNGDPTNPCSLGLGSNCPTPPDACPGLSLAYFMDSYLKGVADPISAGETRSQVDCNSAGAGQYGVQRLAIGNSNANADPAAPNFPSLNYLQILTHYYPGVQVKNAHNGNAVLTPTYRWLPLAVDWGSGAVRPPTMNPGNTYNVALRLQNAGTIAWDDEVKLIYYWVRNGARVTNSTAIDVANLTEGRAIRRVLPCRCKRLPASVPAIRRRW